MPLLLRSLPSRSLGCCLAPALKDIKTNTMQPPSVKTEDKVEYIVQYIVKSCPNEAMISGNLSYACEFIIITI